ncbi:DUF3180 domain-containing protein [Corynebacterium testudinoris]|uniref:Putative DUF3180 family protein n=1 Tax=Corynebacterium testudinoris TaxID=136857 RepID=A0A0G3HF37_9CORY|nr:DUF3180 domain-containing protein [Corynebacterium testudinoris]AKK09742.1 putative DUF3180 family protein [Corynebacterium testudinoris]MBX8996252.1 DUF3180 domain-containing protein [Corynebacterium testudinoris]
MKRTPIIGLVAAGGFTAAVAAILTWGFYGSMTAIPVTVSITLWALAALCLFLGWKVRSRLDEGRIGQDRSQLNPVTAAQFLVLAKASAWTGAILGGGYLGMASYILPRVDQLVAASEDLPGVLASALGGLALSAAGLYLERHCETPPPSDGEMVG